MLPKWRTDSMTIVESSNHIFQSAPGSSRTHRTLVVGTGAFTDALLSRIDARPELGYSIVGLVGDQDIVRKDGSGYPVLGGLEDLRSIVSRTNPKRIIVALDGTQRYLHSQTLVEAKLCNNVVVEDGKKTYERITGEIPLEELTPGGVIYSSDFQPSRISLAATRLMSLVLAVIGLLVLSPLLLLISILIKLDSRGPVFFVQDRVGLGGRSFRLYKFRTMRPATERVSEWAGDNGHRITRVGKYLRKFRLDELPQFFNVIAGHMNLVGPRPHPMSNYRMLHLVSRNTPLCGVQIPYYSLRTLVRPGITGWAQVRYRYANNLDEEIEKLRFDLYYVKHYSFWLDIRILFETVKVVVTGNEGIRCADKNANSKLSPEFTGSPVFASTSTVSTSTVSASKATGQKNSRS